MPYDKELPYPVWWGPVLKTDQSTGFTHLEDPTATRVEDEVIDRVAASETLERIAQTPEGQALILDAQGIKALPETTKRRYRKKLRDLGLYIRRKYLPWLTRVSTPFGCS